MFRSEHRCRSRERRSKTRSRSVMPTAGQCYRPAGCGKPRFSRLKGRIGSSRLARFRASSACRPRRSCFRVLPESRRHRRLLVQRPIRRGRARKPNRQARQRVREFPSAKNRANQTASRPHRTASRSRSNRCPRRDFPVCRPQAR